MTKIDEFDSGMIESLSKCLADTNGVRVRWDDANTLIRAAAGDCIRWETTVDNHVVEQDGTITLTLGHADGSASTEGKFDLLVGIVFYKNCILILGVLGRVFGIPRVEKSDVYRYRRGWPGTVPAHWDQAFSTAS